MRCALGLRMHSGWGVLVAVLWERGAIEVLARQRIVTVDPGAPGAHQPYHHVARSEFPDPERYLAERAEASIALAVKAIDLEVKTLAGSQYQVTGAAVLWSSGRPLPSLAKILASHPLRHTAEGEFFRQAARQACERLQIPVIGIRERELESGRERPLAKRRARLSRVLPAWEVCSGRPGPGITKLRPWPLRSSLRSSRENDGNVPASGDRWGLNRLRKNSPCSQ